MDSSADSTEVSSSTKTFDDLPDELLEEIFVNLPIEELVADVQFVCRRWHDVIQYGTFWKDYVFDPPVSYSTEKVQLLLSRMPHLKSCVLRESHHVHVFANTLRKNCKELTHINLNVSHLNPQELELLCRDLPNLEYLCVPYYVLNSPISLSALRSCINLRHLKCSWMDSEPHWELIQPLVEEYPCDMNIESLMCLELPAFNAVTLLEHLIEDNAHHILSLIVIPYDSLFPIILECTKLEELKMNFISRPSDELTKFLHAVGKLNHLKSLSLRQFVHPNKDILCSLFIDGNLPSLTELDLNNCMNFSPRVAASLARCCPALQKLLLKACIYLDDKCIEQIVRCRDLRILDVSGCKRLTEIAAVYIARLHQLHTLYFTWIPSLTRLMLESLGESRSLQKVYLDFNVMSNDDVISMASKMPSLVFLSVFQCPDLNHDNLKQALRSVRINFTHNFYQNIKYVN